MFSGLHLRQVCVAPLAQGSRGFGVWGPIGAESETSTFSSDWRLNVWVSHNRCQWVSHKRLTSVATFNGGWAAGR
jgi:hypothetical protein